MLDDALLVEQYPTTWLAYTCFASRYHETENWVCLIYRIRVCQMASFSLSCLVLYTLELLTGALLQKEKLVILFQTSNRLFQLFWFYISCLLVSTRGIVSPFSHDCQYIRLLSNSKFYFGWCRGAKEDERNLHYQYCKETWMFNIFITRRSDWGNQSFAQHAWMFDAFYLPGH